MAAESVSLVAYFAMVEIGTGAILFLQTAVPFQPTIRGEIQ